MFVSEFTAAKKFMREGGSYFIFLLPGLGKKFVSDLAVNNKFFLSVARPKSDQQQYVTVFKIPNYILNFDCSKNLSFRLNPISECWPTDRVFSRKNSQKIIVSEKKGKKKFLTCSIYTHPAEKSETSLFLI